MTTLAITYVFASLDLRFGIECMDFVNTKVSKEVPTISFPTVLPSEEENPTTTV
jgi:hypothetical protein